MSIFGIPEDQRDALILSNSKSYVFDAQLLEYFLLLFPSPEITFHLRLDWQQLRRGLSKARPLKRKRTIDLDVASDQSVIKEKKKQNEEQVQEQDYKAVAVYRQNCFLGSLPSNGAVPVRRQNYYFREQELQRQQLEMFKPRPQPKEPEELTQTQEPQKKRLCLKVCATPKRTGSTSVSPISDLVMRSIRI